MARLDDDENEMMNNNNNSYEVNSSDDEEIDEDEAFNSDDELMYGEFFLSSNSIKKKKKNDGDKKMKAKSLNSSSDESDESDDESDSDSDVNDWAGGNGSDDDDSNEGEEDDGGAYMLDLLNNLDKQVPKSATDKKKQQHENKGEGGKISYTNQLSEAAVHLKESEYQSGVLSAMNNEEEEEGGDGKLTLDSLMGGISDTAGFATVQKSMRALSSGLVVDKDKDGKGQQKKKKLTTTAAPVSRVISDRASRKVHYEATTEEVTQWKDAIHEQRDAETLDFRTNKGGATTNRITRDVLVDKFEATTDFEKEIQVALEKAGMDNEGSMLKKEKSRLTGEQHQDDNDIDDLGSNHITMEEYKKRHGELAKLRALMFYEEQKRHRINKIKSKKYRKIRKRQKDKLTSAEMDAAAIEDPTTTDRERIEREEMDRMKERMTLAHKNTSKWARHMLRRGAKMDIEERRALSLQIAKGEELRRKVMGEDDNNDSDDEEETEEDLLKKARDILMENDDDETNTEGSKKKKGLFQLAFMERGMQAQRTRAKEEARKLLEELEANEVAGMSSSDSSDSDDEDGEELKSNKKKKQRIASESETNKVLSEGKLVASSLKFGKGDGFAIKVDGDIKLGGDELKGKEVEKKETKKKQKKKPKLQAPVKPTPPQAEEEEENPWIISKSTKKSSKPLSRTVNIDKAASMLVDNVQEDKTAKRKRDDDVDDNKTILLESTTAADTPPASSKKEVGVAELSQAELVRRAFAKPADLEAEEEFQKEKERMKERDDPTRKKVEEKVVSGWGSWAGAGAPPPRKRKLPPKLRAPASKKVDKEVKRKDDGLSTVIINQKRLKKTAAFQLSEIPYPYRSREEYEKAIAGNIGQEWNTMKGSKEMSRPAILVRAGKIINPLTKKAKSKQKRAPAKF